MKDIKIEKFNSVHFRIICKDQSVAMELYEHFSFPVEGAKFMPAFKAKLWDGIQHMYNLQTKLIYVGLYEYIIDFAKKSGYSIEDNSEIEKNSHISMKDIEDYIKNVIKPHSNGVPIEVRDYQINAIFHSVVNKRCVLLSPTSSGKSLILYSIIRYLLDHDLVERVLFIVPSISLLSQIRSDFNDYSSVNGWDVDDNCHSVFAGADKDDYSKQVIFSTWQSLQKMHPQYYKGIEKNGKRIGGFDGIFVDETHTMVGKVLTSILEKANEVLYRIGCTGTLYSGKANKLLVEGLTGAAFVTTTTNNLMKNGQVANLNIKCLVLKYSEEKRKIFKGTEYADEMKFIASYTPRNQFIAKLANSFKENSLLLVAQVEHGRILSEMLEKMGHQQVFFLHGNVSPEIRESVRQRIEKLEGAIIVATYGVFSTGINVRNLHHLIFSSPSKSRVRVLQSLGRLLRLFTNKDGCTLYDVIDDLSWKSTQNHTMKHFAERINYYNEEKFKYKIIPVEMK